ncbi:MAG: ATP-binding protein [Stappiaceae bacterium]
MFWKRLSVTKKLFAAIAVTTIIMIACMAGLIAYSMRAGFSQYLLEAQLDRFDRLVVALEETYVSTQNSWPGFEGRGTWHAFVRQHLGSPPGDRRPGRRADPNPAVKGPAIQDRRDNGPAGGTPPPNRRPGKSRPRDPLQLGGRLALLDVQERVIAGQLQENAAIAKRAIEIVGSSGTPRTVGWLAISEPEGGAASADNVFLRGQFRSLIMTSLLAIVLSAGAAFFLARQFLTPVSAIMRSTQKLAAGNYATRMDNTRGDEFGMLINHFNQLAESLEVAEKAERQWISDASHELQTPLSVLQAEIEAIQDGVRKADDRTLVDMHTAVMRLSRLVGDLNALSHAREGRLLTLMAEEDLSAIAKSAVDGIRARFAEKGLSLSLDVDNDVVLPCDRLRIRQLLDNLLENARRYTNVPGKVVLKVRQSGDRAVVELDDTPPAPPAETLEKLFDRFYRAESSRARQHGGSGLGLAICRAIVVAHRGSINAKISDLGGLKVSVSLPIDLVEEKSV